MASQLKKISPINNQFFLNWLFFQKRTLHRHKAKRYDTNCLFQLFQFFGLNFGEFVLVAFFVCVENGVGAIRVAGVYLYDGMMLYDHTLQQKRGPQQFARFPLLNFIHGRVS